MVITQLPSTCLDIRHRNVPSIGKEHVVVWVHLNGVRVMLDGIIVIFCRKGLVAESEGMRCVSRSYMNGLCHILGRETHSLCSSAEVETMVHSGSVNGGIDILYNMLIEA